jgi:dTDP-D-glucose 4,6-dehydratase
MQGDNFDADGAEVTFFDRQETMDGDTLAKVTYQLQAVDETSSYHYTKAAKVEFTADANGVYAKLVEKGKPGEAYNIGSGKSMFISDILDIIISKAKVEIKAEVDPAKLRPIEVLDVTADTTKVKELTGWEPEIPIEQTIEDTLEYWRNISKNA